MRNLQLLFTFLTLSNFAYSQTEISGGIYSNTLWSPTGSPYIVSGKVTVFEGVELSIAPGTLVKFNADASLEIRGKLTAKGTVTDSIEFTSNLNSPGWNSWIGIIANGTNLPQGVGDQITMEYCIGKHALYFVDLDYGVHGPYIFKHCYFGNNFQVNRDGGYPVAVFDHCTFEDNRLGLDWGGDDFRVSHCNFINNVNGLNGVAIVDTCYFSGNTGIALSPYGATSGCTIENNNIGVSCYFGSTNNTFVNNVITNNQIGVEILSYFNTIINFTGNKICDNLYNVKNSHFNNADLSLNCWCSTDSAYIRSTILDGYVNTEYGLIDFMPLSENCTLTNLEEHPEYEKNESKVAIFPNPFKNELRLDLGGLNEVEINIYDFQAHPVFQKKCFDSTTIQTDNLSPGVFMYVILSSGRILDSGRIVKIE